jgi:hypothetical protein
VLSPKTVNDSKLSRGVVNLVIYLIFSRCSVILHCLPLSKYLELTMHCAMLNHCTGHSSLLRTFGFSATSTYDSYLLLIFGKFALIWGHYKNVLASHFWGHWGRRGQTASKSKTMKILNDNLLKLDEIQNLASATSKMTSLPQRPRKRLREPLIFIMLALLLFHDLQW